MIFADKLIALRKKKGWSQEELAEKMNVSRQAVSKWESAQSLPDLGKILALSALFDVTTDYLLKDELESETSVTQEATPTLRGVSLAQARAYLEHRKAAAKQIALATLLCILSPVVLILLVGASEFHSFSENLAGGLGMLVLFALVAVAVFLFTRCGFQNSPYEFLDKEPFELEQGVKDLVQQQQNEYRASYAKYNLIGCCLCVLSPIPVVVAAFLDHALYVVCALAVTIVLAGIGVLFFILAGVRWSSMQRLLKEGEFSATEKRKNSIIGTISSVYWLLTTAIYLGISFASSNWGKSWIVWPVAGVLYAAVMALSELFISKNDNQ